MTDITGLSQNGQTQVLGVSDLANLVKEGLGAVFPGELWVEGQVSGLREARSGHVYFELVEPSDVPGRAVGAKFAVALFSRSKSGVERTLDTAGGLRLTDNLLLRIRARLEFYAPHGRLQLIMDGVDPTFTLGQLAIERDRLLQTLSSEGLLRANRAIPIPTPPLSIGLVTSLGSAAHADFTDELAQSGMPFIVLEHDARVQGDGAADDLAKAIIAVSLHQTDVVAIVRGGGSAADLAAFDAEVLARTIASLEIPVLTGIGHEIDRSVADEVAHSSFKTPTACAASLVDQVRWFSDTVDALRLAVVTKARANTERAVGLLQDMSIRTVGLATSVLHRHDDRLDQQVARLSRLPTIFLNRHNEMLEAKLDRLRALDPTRILSRGWSITRLNDGSLVQSVAKLPVGTPIVTTVADGEVTSTVDSVSEQHFN